ncbi:alkene reductase [Caballeronia insecticola]|uniref:Probable flavoprotein nadh-dependent oxidoreductase n=1 Tax=Caballeronia insecticola TaxID=758793 RepID=R4WJF5_9BURK|nr:alkene reductase [Caballeronia insecticola]BAN24593.1 probable flavoprotein nadh-dependent oxidoreductase [Caballeronia insecticola]
MPYETLLSAVVIGNLEVPNRVVMAPLARHRAAQPGDVPTETSAHYYAQRAGAGLIVTEPAHVSPEGQGGLAAPGICSDAQEAGWKNVAGAVHARQGRIAVQLSHAGRMSHRRLQEGGAPPVAPSAVRARGVQVFAPQDDGTPGFVDADDPRPLESAEIAGIVLQYVDAAHRAHRAGFDMIEIDASNGYLLHQFIATGTNRRTDDYGGSVENRVRIVVEIVEAVASVIGAHRVGVRLSPGFTGADIEDAEAQASSLYLAGELARIGIAYVHLADAHFIDAFRDIFNGAIIACGDDTAQDANARIERGEADAVAFGRAFVANPDLVERLKADAPLAEPDAATIHGGGEQGYTDYPTLGDARRSENNENNESN